MMVAIEVSFDAYKELTVRRASESTSYDDVIRGLLKMPPSGGNGGQQGKRSWTYKGVTFPHGTEFRANYKGHMHTAGIDDGRWFQDGVARGSPSEAANAVTGNNVNGWAFWEAKLPGESRWRVLKSFR